MTIFESLAIIAMAGLIHASFQLSVSMLTLLSSHTIGAKRSARRLIGLTNSFIAGVLVMTLLLVSTTAFVVQTAGASSSAVTWVAICGLLLGLGVAVWIFYYRREQGTTLWLPRGMARFLSDRTKATKQTAEAFSLGLASVLAELLFIVAPVALCALVLVRLQPTWQLAGIALYLALSLSPLLVVGILIGGGHKISGIQRWREQNKRFLQFVAGSALVVLGFYVYVEQVLTPTVMAAAGGL